MTHQTTTLRFFDLRAALVIAALVSLCVSKNVGPQFLPLPGLSQRVAESQADGHLSTASRFSLSESNSFRVPMVGRTHKRVGTEVQPQPLVTFALRSTFEQPLDGRTTYDYLGAILFCSSALVEQAPGRGPPLLV